MNGIEVDLIHGNSPDEDILLARAHKVFIRSHGGYSNTLEKAVEMNGLENITILKQKIHNNSYKPAPQDTIGSQLVEYLSENTYLDPRFKDHEFEISGMPGRQYKDFLDTPLNKIRTGHW